MKKQFLNILALVLAITITSFNTINEQRAKEKALDFIRKNYDSKASAISWVVFEYVWGPHGDPNSYRKVPFEYNISGHCPGSDRLCAILAQEDIFFNPGHPTLSSLSFLMTTYGYGFYFGYEVTGLIEFSFW